MAIKRISRAFKDINLSFRPHPVTKDLTILRNENAIKRSVRNLVQTIPTERFFNSVLGSDVRSSLFEFVDYGTASTIQEQIDRYMPFIRNLRLNFDADKNEDFLKNSNILSLTIIYDIPSINITSEILVVEEEIT